MKTSGAAERPRKSLSFYDKMEEARQRRAAVLSTPQSVKPKRKTAGKKAAPVPTPEPVSIPAPLQPVVAFSEAPDTDAVPRRTPRLVIRALALLLLALVIAAFFQGRGFSPLTAAVFKPPMVRLDAPATPAASPAEPVSLTIHEAPRGGPILVASPGRDDLPAFVPTVPAARGPELVDLLDALTPPPARPASLVTVSGDAS